MVSPFNFPSHAAQEVAGEMSHRRSTWRVPFEGREWSKIGRPQNHTLDGATFLGETSA